MELPEYRPLKDWAKAFEQFRNVKSVRLNSSAETLSIRLSVPDKSDPPKNVDIEKMVTQDNLEDTLYKFSGNTGEVAKYFLRVWGVLIYAEEALVGFFDIYAYSAFIENNPMNKCITEIGNFFNTISRDAASCSRDIKLKHWILSDSVIIMLDTDGQPMNCKSIDFFLHICSALLLRGVSKGFPLRGAIGAGSFYKDGEIIVSSALVNAAKFEKLQNWLGAVITPQAYDLIRKHCPQFPDSLANASLYLGRGKIPWKKDNRGKSGPELPSELYHVFPPHSSSDWIESLPAAIRGNKDCREIIENSHYLYRRHV